MQRRRDERGAAVVEFALILPLLVLFVFGIVEFGRAYSARIELTSAVREGARAVALGANAAEAETVTKDAAPGLARDRLTVPTPTLCTVTPAPPNARVEAHYPFTYTIPFFRDGTWTLQATGVMRCGG
ncbi:MAG TPA: TadE family protein [Acidimicrobiales bacterium]|nr:TadE family protein [Acidimicrobiales bacterium]